MLRSIWLGHPHKLKKLMEEQIDNIEVFLIISLNLYDLDTLNT